MKQIIGMVRRAGRLLIDIRVIYAIVGFVVSIFAHELVHILLHLGSIDSVQLFPNLQTIFSVHVDYVARYNVRLEEVLAYSVTFLVQFVTIIDVIAIHDSRNHTSSQQVIFGESDFLSERERGVLLQLVSR